MCIRDRIKGIRKAMMTQMNLANQIPHFSYCDEVRMDALMAARMQLKPLAEAYGVPKFTLIPLMIKATSLALAAFPLLNSSVSDDEKTLTQLHFQPGDYLDVAVIGN